MRLVHLARVSAERGIARSGLRGTKWTIDVAGRRTEIARGVFAMPLLADWASTFQWLRELRRWHDERMVAVHFRVPDDELVIVGRYGARHERMTATRASRHVRDDAAGAEIIVPRSIPRADVLAIRRTPQLVGWTEAPEEAHRRTCVCRRCLPPGLPDRGRRLRAEVTRALGVLARSKDARARRLAIAHVAMALESAGPRGGIPEAPFVRLARDEDAAVRAASASLFCFYPLRVAEPVLRALLDDAHSDVRRAAADALVRRAGPMRAASLLFRSDGPASAELVDAVREDLEWRTPERELVALRGRIDQLAVRPAPI